MIQKTCSEFILFLETVQKDCVDVVSTDLVCVDLTCLDLVCADLESHSLVTNGVLKESALMERKIFLYSKWNSQKKKRQCILSWDW